MIFQRANTLKRMETGQKLIGNASIIHEIDRDYKSGSFEKIPVQESNFANSKVFRRATTINDEKTKKKKTELLQHQAFIHQKGTIIKCQICDIGNLT